MFNHFAHGNLAGAFKYVFYFSLLLGGNDPILTNIFQMCWNHQPVKDVFFPAKQNIPG